MLITPVPGERSFECCEVATVDPNGTGCRVWLTNGDTITYGTVSAAAMAAQVVNDQLEELLAGPLQSATFGEGIYVSAQNVAQLRELSAVGLGTSLVTMKGGPGPFVLTGLAAVLEATFNGTARCGASAGTPTFIESLPFVLDVSSPAGNTVSENGPTEYQRVGPPGSTGPAVGDTVQASTRVFVTDILIGESLSLIIDSPFPIPNAGFQCTSNLRVIAGTASDWEGGLLINRASSDTFSVQGGPSTFAGTTTLMVDLAWTHLVDGV